MPRRSQQPTAHLDLPQDFKFFYKFLNGRPFTDEQVKTLTPLCERYAAWRSFQNGIPVSDEGIREAQLIYAAFEEWGKQQMPPFIETPMSAERAAQLAKEMCHAHRIGAAPEAPVPGGSEFGTEWPLGIEADIPGRRLRRTGFDSVVDLSNHRQLWDMVKLLAHQYPNATGSRVFLREGVEINAVHRKVNSLRKKLSIIGVTIPHGRSTGNKYVLAALTLTCESESSG